MGAVYLAHNKLLGRDEVLKVVGSYLLNRQGVLDRFLREIRSAAKLHHPNIVTAYSALPLGENLALSMDYAEGYDLAQIVGAKGRFRCRRRDTSSIWRGSGFSMPMSGEWSTATSSPAS
jgi:serine/threonine protein kinase